MCKLLILYPSSSQTLHLCISRTAHNSTLIAIALFISVVMFTFGEGKRRKEFAEWYVEWRAEWHNYAKYDLRGE